MRSWWLGLVIAACHPAAPAEPISPNTTQSSGDATPEPRKGRTIVTDTKVEVLDPIRFLTGSAALDARSTPILDAIASTLTGNPSIKLVAVHAYGADALVQFQGRLGAERAQAIVDQLVARGVAPTRLVPQGGAAPPPGGSMGPSLEILARNP